MIWILYIEDTPEILYNKKDGLERTYGFKVIDAWSTKDALKKANEYKNKINIILLDIMMPTLGEFSENQAKQGYMTGFLLIDKLNQIFEKELPIIVQTAYSDKNDLRIIRNHPQVKELLPRNARISEIAEKIKDILKDKLIK